MIFGRTISLCLLIILGVLLFPGTTLCQDSLKVQAPLNAEPFELFYVHVGVGLGFDVYTSSQIKDILPEGFQIGVKTGKLLV